MLKYAILAFLNLILLSEVAFAQPEKQISIANMPPSVVKTVPQCGDTQVDPSLREVRVTFSKEMMTDRMWSWVIHSKATFPKIDAQGIRYLEDDRTCVLPVRLAPNRTFVIWINSQKYNAFKDRGNRSAIPYLLVFETKQ